jgi:hypothetical protein
MFKRNKVLSLALALALAFCFSSYSNAQTLGPGDCSTDSTTNFVTGTGCANSTQSTTTIFDSTNGDFNNMTRTGTTSIITDWYGQDEIWFQHTQDAWAVNLAITTALASAGIKVDGYSASWEVFNRQTNTINGRCTVAKTNGVCIDPLTITLTAKDSNGNNIYSQIFDYGAMNTHNINPSASDPHWYQESVLSWIGSGQLTPGSGIASVDINIAGYDAGFWQGNYGPRVKNMVGSLILSVDICASTPLHSSSCPGYATAYATQQYNTNCAANALYDSGCPGYSAAYQTQQCNANPLYSTACSGYTAAYYNQQCSINALYDSGCNGYATAYFNQQCGLDTLYNSNCPGYATAYFNHQCAANPLYDSQCPGYATAYFNQQCSANTLYDSQCPGYATAYFNAQCSASALYNSQCPGYATAYFNQQCGISALYDSACSGYAQAYLAQQCAISPLYDSQCNGYALAYYNQQCTLFPANDASCSGYYTAQCDISSLFDPGCTGYQTAFVEQQCSVNPQYDQSCIGYVDLSVGTVEDVASVLEPTIQEAVNNTTQVSVPLAILALNTPAVELPVVVPVEVIVVAVPIGEPANSFDAPKETVASASVNLEDSIEREINALEEVDTTEEVVVIEEVVEVEESVSAITEDGSEEEKVVVIEETTDKEETTEEVVVEEKIVKKPTPKQVLTKKQKAKAKAKKVKEIVQARGESLAQQMSVAATVEVQKQLQNQLLAIIGFVPDFSKYGKTNINGGTLQQEVNLKGGRIVDHQFSRWFLNDPGFAALEEQQYNLRSN